MIKLILLLFFSVNSYSNTLSISPGHVRFVKFELSSTPKSSYVICKNKKIPFDNINGKTIYFYLSESYFSGLKPYKCSIDLTSGKNQIININLKKYAYPETHLKVEKKYVSLSKKNLARHQKEKVKLGKIYSESAPIFLFDDAFIKPLNSKLTSYYGSRRIFNKSRRTQHLGNDFRAATGVKIPVSNSGKVVMAEDLFFSGNTVIVDHGLGIFTMYGHLSKIVAKVGMMVKRGEIIGLAGATGRVTASHLHWGVKVHGNWIDGIKLVDESKKHFSEFKKILQVSSL